MMLFAMSVQFSPTIFVGEIPSHLPDSPRVKGDPNELVDGVKKVKKSQVKSRGRRWYEITWLTEDPKKPFPRVIDEEGSCNFHPYPYTPQGVFPINFCIESSDTVSIQSSSSLQTKLQILLAIASSSQFPSR